MALKPFVNVSQFPMPNANNLFTLPFGFTLGLQAYPINAANPNPD
jgi:hypothetical protein